MAQTPIRAGAIGCGGMGRHHVEALAAHQAFDLVAGCDVNPDAFANLPDGVPRYQDAEEMLARHELDLVTIVVPSALYEPMVELAARHGADVFTEKPFGHRLDSSRNMIAALAEAVGGDESAYMTDVRRAERIMCVVDACYRSAREGRPVDVE